MLIPLAHQEQLARRWPWVTTVIIALNIVLWLLLRTPMQEGLTQVEYHRALAVAYAKKVPEVSPCPWVEKAGARGGGYVNRAELNRLVLGKEDPQSKQVVMDELCSQVEVAEHQSVAHSVGYVPGHNNWFGLLGYQFLHGGLFHLLFNMWFLWLAGAVIEDAWGRVAYPLFYFSAGIFAALCHKAAAWDSLVPLIGASGAVAGAMGAFLVKHARTKIRMVFWYFLRPHVFWAPAYIILPLWFVGELMWALVSAAGRAGGTAYWAHVGGFLFGFGFAFALKHSGVEKKLDAMIEARDEVIPDRRLAGVWKLVDQGQLQQALMMLDVLAEAEPFNLDIHTALLQVAERAEDRGRRVLALRRLVDIHLRSARTAEAASCFEELSLIERVHISLRNRLRIGQYWAQTGARAKAGQLFLSLYQLGGSQPEIVEAMIEDAELKLRDGAFDAAGELFERTAGLAKGLPRLDARVQAGLSAAAQRQPFIAAPAADRYASEPRALIASEAPISVQPPPSPRGAGFGRATQLGGFEAPSDPFAGLDLPRPISSLNIEASASPSELPEPDPFGGLIVEPISDDAGPSAAVVAQHTASGGLEGIEGVAEALPGAASAGLGHWPALTPPFEGAIAEAGVASLDSTELAPGELPASLRDLPPPKRRDN